MTEKDPNKKVMEFFEEHAFFKPTAKKEMNAYMERERKRQVEEGMIDEESEKINLQTAIEREDDK